MEGRVRNLDFTLRSMAGVEVRERFRHGKSFKWGNVFISVVSTILSALGTMQGLSSPVKKKKKEKK